jgi:cell filamentation protein
MVELYTKPVHGHFDLRHLREIHKFIFQDVYPFAGKIREENISKGQTVFAQVPYIKEQSEQLFRSLKQEKFLRELDVRQFSERASHYLAEINILHPFREGNGRSHRELIRCLGLNAGYEIRWSNVDRDTLLNAMIKSVTDTRDLVKVFDSVIVNREPEKEFLRFFEMLDRGFER